MPTPPGKRPYRMRKRSEAQAGTRQRIVEAAMHLHEEVGPRATTISAIADRAGVQRLTVYRHFPDETAVFQACTQHWLALHPPPDPATWADVEDPVARVRAAIAAFHAYYRATARMWWMAHRDEPDVPALGQPMQDFRAYLAGIADALASALGPAPADARALAATVRHGLAFGTWDSLRANGLGGDEAVALVARWIDSVRDAA